MKCLPCKKEMVGTIIEEVTLKDGRKGSKIKCEHCGRLTFRFKTTNTTTTKCIWVSRGTKERIDKLRGDLSYNKYIQKILENNSPLFDVNTLREEMRTVIAEEIKKAKEF